MRRIVFLLCALSLAFLASAGTRFDSLSVHPAEPQIGKPILLLVRGFWTDGCGGTLDVQASAERIDIFQTSRNTPGIFCTTALVQFSEIINPQEYLPAGTGFANRVDVRFFRRTTDTPDVLMGSDSVEFTSKAPPAPKLVSGSFSAATLEISGLFVDQQEGTVSTMLTDYDEQGRSSWRFGAGKMHGDVYIGELSRYHQIACVTTPCPRSAANAVGKINLIALNANELYVSYRNALAPDASGSATHYYQRLVFNRAATLPREPAQSAWIPDLTGEWLVGVTGTDTQNAEFKRYRISYSGKFLLDSDGADRFSAISATDPRDFFQIICSDDRPVDGVQGCRVESYRALQRTCAASIAPNDVVLGNVRVAADCDQLETEFLMQRLAR